MAIQITTLSENTANIGCLAEWGLSILITTKNLNILMDTGRSLSATYNADTLGIDLSRVDKIVLKEMGIKKLGLCHCTGFTAAARLYHDMADVFWLNSAGTRLTLP